MKNIKLRNIGMIVAGFFCCRVPLAGCLPLLPAFFTAVYLEQIPRAVFTIAVFAGMAVFLPITQVAKYGTAVLVILVIIRLREWTDKYCNSWLAAITAGATVTALSVGGHFLRMKDSVSIQIGILEGILIIGLTMLLSRIVHGIVEFKLSFPVKVDERKKPSGRLEKYADSFQGLSKVFYGMERRENISGEEMYRMTNELAERCCVNCGTCASCWGVENAPARDYFKKVMDAVVRAGKTDRDAVQVEENCCPYHEKVVDEALKVFEKVSLNMAWYNRLIENRIVIAEQLDAMAYIMEELAEGEEEISAKRKRFLGNIKYRAREHGIKVTECSIWKKKNGREKLILEVSQRGERCVPLRILTEEVNAVYHKPMIAARDSRNIIGKEKMEVVYEEEPRYHSVFGMAKRTKDEAAISGDNFSVTMTENGEMVYSLSDGMGFGSRACKESELVLELIEKFLEAGFDEETSIRMMNSAMVIHGEDEKYSTIDLCSLNLYDGTCSFYKVGAAAGFIKRGEQVEAVLSSSLPVGSLYGMEADRQERQLYEGDFLIMVTDGVLEDLHVPDPVITMEEIIETIQVNHPGKMAEKIIQRVLTFTGGYVRDDMTVLVAALWEN